MAKAAGNIGMTKITPKETSWIDRSIQATADSNRHDVSNNAQRGALTSFSSVDLEASGSRTFTSLGNFARNWEPGAALSTV